MQADPNYVLSFFRDQLNSENIHRRTFAAKNLNVVAASMGPENVRKLLVPFLMEARSLDGEVQMHLAAGVGNLIKYVGGPDFAHLLLGPLKVLSSCEELIVREKAVTSMVGICNAIPSTADCDTFFMNTARELSQDTFFTARSSACAFIVLIYGKVSEQNQVFLRKIYKDLVKDETPMVRRAALQALPKLCEVLPGPILRKDIFQEIIAISVHDDEDSVRLLVPASLSVISAQITDAERVENLLPVCKMVVKDQSWRVRAAIATELPTISQTFTPEMIITLVIPLLIRLMHDPEAEAKIQAIISLSGILPHIKDQGEQVAELILPEISKLVSNEANLQNVKREVALRMFDLARIVGNQNTRASIVPLFIQVLHESDHVTSNALLTSLLEHVDDVDLPSICPAILPVLLEISSETHWRVKLVIIKLIPHLASAIGNDEFLKKLFPLVLAWLPDMNYSVREAMAGQLGNLCQIVGESWATGILFEKLSQLIEKKEKPVVYLDKMVYLMCTQKLIGFMNMQILTRQFLPKVLEMTNDPVPNVKIMVAKTLAKFVNSQDPKVNQQIVSSLKVLAGDKDKDVEDFAKQALAKFQ